MSERQQIHVHIDRVVSDQPLDEGALRNAVVAELRQQLVGTGSRASGAPSTQEMVAQQIAQRVQCALPPLTPRGESGS